MEGEPTGSKGEQDELIGETVDGRFRLEEKLGEGAVGRVYRATQLSIERSVALKMLHGDFRRNEEYQKRFLREAKVISGFNHPNIVRLIDYGEDQARQFSYLVMEFVEGVELGDLVAKGRFAPEFALEIAHQIAGGLFAAHQQNIIHRDLKAENIILVPVPGGTFQAKILDFGVALPRQDGGTRLTAAGDVFGTPAYMSPEQAEGDREIGQTADLYSLGALLFEMLTGELPFQESSTLKMMVAHIQQEVPDLNNVVDDLHFPESLNELVQTLMSKAPGERPPDGDALRDEIDQVREEHGWSSIDLNTEKLATETFNPWIGDDSDASSATESQSSGEPSSPSSNDGEQEGMGAGSVDFTETSVGTGATGTEESDRYPSDETDAVASEEGPASLPDEPFGPADDGEWEDEKTKVDRRPMGAHESDEAMVSGDAGPAADSSPRGGDPDEGPGSSAGESQVTGGGTSPEPDASSPGADPQQQQQTSISKRTSKITADQAPDAIGQDEATREGEIIDDAELDTSEPSSSTWGRSKWLILAALSGVGLFALTGVVVAWVGFGGGDGASASGSSNDSTPTAPESGGEAAAAGARAATSDTGATPSGPDVGTDASTSHDAGTPESDAVPSEPRQAEAADESDPSGESDAPRPGGRASEEDSDPRAGSVRETGGGRAGDETASPGGDEPSPSDRNESADDQEGGLPDPSNLGTQAGSEETEPSETDDSSGGSPSETEQPAGRADKGSSTAGSEEKGSSDSKKDDETSLDEKLEQQEKKSWQW